MHAPHSRLRRKRQPRSCQKKHEMSTRIGPNTARANTTRPWHLCCTQRCAMCRAWARGEKADNLHDF
eukprot:3619059-Lingulodinium_polyedra.AAC.1